MDVLLWIDDEREAPFVFTHWAKTADEAINVLENLSEDDVLTLVSFDHDLGALDNNGREMEVRPVVHWMVEHNVYPLVAMIHSHNHSGARWIKETLRDYNPVLAVVVQPFKRENYAYSS